MKKKTIIVASAIGAVFLVGGIAGGVALHTHQAQQALNAEYAAAVADMEETANTLALHTQSLVVLAEDITGENGSDNELHQDVWGMVTPVVDQTEVLIDPATVSANLTSIEGNRSSHGLDKVTSQAIIAHISTGTQGDDQESGVAQSEVPQPGKTDSLELTEKMNELGYLLPGVEEVAQSRKDAQSDGGVQQSGGSQSGDIDREPYWSIVSTTDKPSREDLEAVKTLTEKFHDQDKAVEHTGIEIITLQYEAALSGADTELANVSETLTGTIATAESILTDSKGKAADDTTREELQAALDAAKGTAGKTVTDTGRLSAVNTLTEEKTKTIETLDALIESVKNSIAAQEKADREAAEAAATEAARQAELTQQQYSSPNYGADNYTGDNYIADNNYSGGGSSGSTTGPSCPAGGNCYQHPGGGTVTGPSLPPNPGSSYCKELAAAGGSCVA